MKNKIKYLIITIITLLVLSGCGTSADTVRYNLSREADEFKVKRRITFINLRTGEYLFQATGNSSFKRGEINE